MWLVTSRINSGHDAAYEPLQTRLRSSVGDTEV